MATQSVVRMTLVLGLLKCVAVAFAQDTECVLDIGIPHCDSYVQSYVLSCGDNCVRVRLYNGTGTVLRRIVFDDEPNYDCLWCYQFRIEAATSEETRVLQGECCHPHCGFDCLFFPDGLLPSATCEVILCAELIETKECLEFCHDPRPDGYGFLSFCDWDGDCLKDSDEGQAPDSDQTHELLADSDGDGLIDGHEVYGKCGSEWPKTNPRMADTDADRLLDGIELLIVGSDPLDAGDPPAFTDADGDGLPVAHDPDDDNVDTDADRFADGYEAAVLDVTACTDPARVTPLGDVNLDGAVSNADALAVQALFLTKIGPDDAVFQWRGFRYADPSRDGHISNMDALMLQTFFFGRLEVLPRP